MKPLISVIVPAYNVELYVAKCLDSILSQSYTNLEIIIVDDGSTDKTGKICDDYAKLDQRIVVLHKENEGLVKARKNGLSIARGEFIGFVDSDDFISEDMYMELVLLMQREKVDFVHSGYFINDNYYGVDIEKKVNLDDTNRLEVVKGVLLGGDSAFKMTPSIWSKLFRADFCKECYDAISDEVNYGEDLAFLSNCLLKATSFYLLNRAYYYYVYRDSSLSHRIDKRQLTCEIMLYNEIRRITAEYKGIPEYEDIMERYLLLHTVMGINSHPLLRETISIYQIPQFENLKKKKIVLYGAGKVGRDYYRQIRMNLDYDIVLWVDNNYKNIEQKECVISNPECIFDYDFDVIVVALVSNTQRNNVKDYLMNLGVDESKIMLEKPIRIIA